MKEPQRHCLNCGNVIMVGRSDKRYCDDICRARNTRMRQKQNKQFGYEDRHKAIIDAIKRNYRLLRKALVGREEWTVDFSELYFNGFDKQFYTSSKLLENGKMRCYCFELGWEDRNDGSLFIMLDLEKLSVFDYRKSGYFPWETDKPESE